MTEHTLQTAAIHQRKQAATSVLCLRYLDMRSDVGVMVDEPEQAAFEAGEAVNKLRIERLDAKEGNQPDERAHLEVVAIAARQVQHVVIKAVLFVPQFDAIPRIVHRLRDADKVLEKLAGDVFIGAIFAGKLQSDAQHVQAVHAHPTRAVRLLEKSSRRQWSRSVEHANVV